MSTTTSTSTSTSTTTGVSGVTVLPRGVDCALTQLGFGGALGDLASSRANGLTCGIYTQSKSDEPLAFTYKYDEFKLVLEGELHIRDVATGHVVTGTTGDVFNIAKGASLAFTSPQYAKCFFVGQRGAGQL